MKRSTLLLTMGCLLLHSAIAQDGVNHTGAQAKLVEGHNLMEVSGFLKTEDIMVPDFQGVPSDPDGRSFFWHTKTMPDESRISNNSILVKNRKGDYFHIKMNGVYWDCEASWISEKLLLIRVWWARHWGSDYLFDIDSGKTIYQEEFADRHPAFGGQNEKQTEQNAAEQPAIAGESK